MWCKLDAAFHRDSDATATSSGAASGHPSSSAAKGCALAEHAEPILAGQQDLANGRPNSAVAGSTEGDIGGGGLRLLRTTRGGANVLPAKSR